jgi:UDPglucose--hexose-1-phosphate uridylyltransferase
VVSIQMIEPDLRIDPLTGAYVVVTPWRQQRPRLPEGQCPFCPGGIEAPEHYGVRHIPNRWPGLPEGRHEVVLHSPEHRSSFSSMGRDGAVRVVELWAERTAVLGARNDVRYVFIFENRGRLVGATIDHPHSQIMAFSVVPPIPGAELSKEVCDLCGEPDGELIVTRHPEWLASVPWAPSWPYEILIFPRRHIADLPTAGPQLRTALADILVDCLIRVEAIFGAEAPYMLWIHQRPTDGDRWPAGHLHLHLAPVMGRPGVVRNLSSAELGAGMLFNSVDPRQAAADLRKVSGAVRPQDNSAAIKCVGTHSNDKPDLAR